MIDIGSTEFFIGVPSLPRDKFEEYSGHLFDDWESRMAGELALPDYALALEVEEGSIKGWGKVGTSVVALYAGICSYGSFVQGVQTIRSHVVAVGEYLAEKAHSYLGANTPAPTVRKRSGTLGQLQRLFEKVQRRELSVDDAMKEAEAIIGPEATTAPEFMLRLNQSLREAPVYPQQFSLPLDGIEEIPLPYEGNRNSIPSTPKPKHALPPRNQLRMEIWRESKRGKKNVRIIEL